MTKIDDATIRKLANLSNLNIDDSEIAKYAQEIEAILGYIDELMAIDLSDVKPTISTTALQNVDRPDEIIDYQVSSQQLLANAPEELNHQFKVRKVIS